MFHVLLLKKLMDGWIKQMKTKWQINKEMEEANVFFIFATFLWIKNVDNRLNSNVLLFLFIYLFVLCFFALSDIKIM